MNLPIANVIRSLRRVRDVTQEELAAALDVTYQSVSRWENGHSYPDMELIPKIASFFGISTDVLFGTDRKSAEAKRDAHHEKICSVQNDLEAYYEACKATYKEFPDEYSFGFCLCRCYVDYKVRPLAEHMDEVRSICKQIIDGCPTESIRMEAFRMIIISEEDGKIEEWLDMLPTSKYSREVLLEDRYNYRNEIDKCNLQRQENFLSYLTYVFYNCIGKRDEKRYKNPEANAEGYRMVLDVIDAMRDTSTDIDAWIVMRAFFNLRIAAGCFGAGRKEEGYEALEKAIDLYVKFAELTDDAVLSYNCPTLDLLSANKLRDIEYGTHGTTIRWGAYRALTEPAGWEWFNGVRDEARYKAQVERLVPYLPKRKRNRL